MHPLAAEEILASVRRRAAQGDNPTEPAQSVEILEEAILELCRAPAERLRLGESNATNYAGIDLTRHPALKEAYRIACLIEDCGASPELTKASCAAFDFVRTLDKALP